MEELELYYSNNNKDSPGLIQEVDSEKKCNINNKSLKKSKSLKKIRIEK